MVSQTLFENRHDEEWLLVSNYEQLEETQWKRHKVDDTTSYIDQIPGTRSYHTSQTIRDQ